MEFCDFYDTTIAKHTFMIDSNILFFLYDFENNAQTLLNNNSGEVSKELRAMVLLREMFQNKQINIVLSPESIEEMMFGINEKGHDAEIKNFVKENFEKFDLMDGDGFLYNPQKLNSLFTKYYRQYEYDRIKHPFADWSISDALIMSYAAVAGMHLITLDKKDFFGYVKDAKDSSQTEDGYILRKIQSINKKHGRYVKEGLYPINTINPKHKDIGDEVRPFPISECIRFFYPEAVVDLMYNENSFINKFESPLPND